MSSSDETVTVKGLAPSSMILPVRLVYTAVRLLFLLWSGAVLPLALFYARAGNAAAESMLHGAITWVFVVGGMVWILIYIALEQYSYPVTLKSSITLTGGIILNGLSGYRLSDFNFFYGAYQVFISALTAQFLFIAGITSMYSFYKITGNKKEGDMEIWYLYFLTGLSVLLGIMLYMLSGPLINEFHDEGIIVLAGAAVFFFAYNTFYDGVILWRGSIFNSGVMTDPVRNRLYEVWTPLCALCIIISIMAALFAALF